MSEETVGALISARASRGDHPLIIVDKDRLTYAEADRRSKLIAGGLMAAGVGRGSRVGMLYGNRPDFVLAFLAITRIGAVALPFSTMSTVEELRGLIDNSDSEFFITDYSYKGHDLVKIVEKATGAKAGETVMSPEVPILRRIWYGLSELEAAGAGHEAEVEAAQAQVTPADVMALIHTSGSTSRPKGVVHTHGSVLRNMATLNKVRPLTAEHGLFSNSPFFWVGGLAFSLLSTIIAGGKLICSAASPQETLELLLQEKPNYGNGFAASVLPIANDPGFPKDGLPFMRQGNLYPIMAKDSRPPDAELRHNLLGMTETGSVCTIGDNEDNLPESQRGSYGRPTPGMDARVVDPETGEDSKQGEFWVRGPAVMQGYYGLERHEAFAPGGWYRTGDIMHVDDDGLFYFKGRRNDMIKTSGANVSPREVEGVLADLCPGRNVVVLGLPDPERGQIVTGVVLADEKVDEAKLKLEMRGRLSPYKVPRKIVTLKDDSVPRLSSGKIDMKRLAEMVTQAIADEAKATPEKVG